MTDQTKVSPEPGDDAVDIDGPDESGVAQVPVPDVEEGDQ